MIMFFKMLLVFTVLMPPLPKPHSTAVRTLRKLPVQVREKSKILKSAQNQAPIPDALKDRFILVETFETSSGIKINLEVEENSELTRLPGPKHPWPHGSCAMCLGNQLISHFGQSKEYLDEIGYENWGTLYDNLQNDPKFKGVKGKNEGWYQGNSSYSTKGILGRIFRGRR